MARKIRRDDPVIVIAGKDKGKTGNVLRVDTRRNRVFVEGLNMIKRHERPNPQRPQQTGGVIEREGPIHISNVALLDPESNRPTRVGIAYTDGERKRVARRSGRSID